MSDLGTCPNCGSPLMNWGAASHGDGDIFDEIGCDVCKEVIYEKHASYCECIDCAPYLSADDDDAEHSANTDVMSCGHLLAEAYQGEDGGTYCRICESA